MSSKRSPHNENKRPRLEQELVHSSETVATETTPIKVPSKRRNIKVASDLATPYDLTAVDGDSEFARMIMELFADIRPKKIIETGTYLGEGTTRIIASTLKSLGITDSVFCTIECNPGNYHQAQANLAQRGLIDGVHMLHGLSVPRYKLPTIEEIEQSCVNHIEYDDIFIDHQEQQRALLYYRETDFTGVEEDMLGRALEVYGDRPDFVLLDSGGHMGYVEFNYLISRLKGPCYLALDDIFHIKHHKSYRQMQTDGRFDILKVSKEKFGFCLAKFTPDQPPTINDSKQLIWLRPDSIGDNILSASMLPHIRNKYSEAHITVVCQEHIAEFYETCPHVNEIVPFNRQRLMVDGEYLDALLSELKGLKADLLLNSVYSRDPLADLLAFACDARESVALDGDTSNMTVETRTEHNRLYSRIIPSPGDRKGELERHRDFLIGLGITSNDLAPTAWITPDDAAWAEAVFSESGFEAEKTIVMFAGAQYAVRHYERYGEAIAPICREHDMNVIALGSVDDVDISLRNLNQISGRTLNLCGKTTLRQSAAIISRCRLAVGAETGLAHLACAVDTPNVVLLGGGHFGRFMPYSKFTMIACLPLACYGCNWGCCYGRSHCVTDLEPAVLEQAVRALLAGISTSSRAIIQPESKWLASPGLPAWQECSVHIRADIPRGVASVESEAALSSEFERPLPRFSVITPSYNQGKYIEQTILSVLNQQYPDFEHIIIDGGSTDGTPEILKKYPHLRWISEKDQGQSDALNKGFGMASGEIIAWINSDDWYEPGAFSSIAEFFAQDPDRNVVMGDCNLVDENGAIFDTVVNFERGFEELKKHWISRSIPTQPAVFFRKKLLEEFGGLDESLHFAMDYDLWMRFARKNCFYHLDRTVANYRFHCDAKGGDQDWSKFIPDCRIVYKRYCTPAISVVIPCYNYAHFLTNAVESALMQTWQDFEIIIVNDGSTDNSRKVAEQLIAAHPEQLIRLINQDNSADPAIARNRGIQEARGSYILCLDADDVIMPFMLEKCVALLETEPGIAIAYTDQIYFGSEQEQVVQVADYDFIRLTQANFMGYCSLFRKSAWNEVGGFKAGIGYEDWEFWISCGEQGHYAKRIPEPLFCYRQHSGGRYEMDQERDAQIRANIARLHPSLYTADSLRRVGQPHAGGTGGVENDRNFRVIALISSHNEGDVLYHVIGDLVLQGIEVYLINHCSTDNSVEEALKWLGKGLIHIENFPQDAGYPEANKDEYIWHHILRRKEELAAQLDADWYIHSDADEFRESPWPGLTLKQAIQVADRAGYNALDFELLNFRPIDNHFIPGTDVREALCYYEGCEDFNAHQIKAWKNLRVPVNIQQNGGHDINFAGRSVCPTNFILRHYPIRSQAHGEQKVFNERKKRFNAQERHVGWHVQYDTIKDQNHNFLQKPADLTLYDGNQVRLRVLSAQARGIAASLSGAQAAPAAASTADTACKSPDPVQTGQGNLTGENTQLLIDKGNALAKEGNVAEAAQLYRQALAADPGNCSALVGIGVLKIVAGKHSEAAIAFSKALKSNPADAKALCGLGLTRSGQGRRSEGFELFKKALDTDPENLTALHELLRLAYELNRHSEAEPCLRKYLMYHPADFHLLYSLAGLHHRMGKHAEALDVLERLLALEPGYEGCGELAGLARQALCGVDGEVLMAAGA